MLSSQTKTLLRLGTSLMFYTGGGPYKWISKTNRIIFVKSKLHITLCVFNFIAICLYEIFLIYRITNAVLEKAKLNLKVQIGYNIFSYMVPFLLQIQSFLCWKETPKFMNAYIKFYEVFEEKFLLPVHKNRKNGCESISKFFLFLGSLITLQNIIIISKQPDRIYFLTSLLENPKSASFLVKFPFLFLQVWVWLSLWAQLYFWIFNFFAFAYIGTFILDELRAKKKDPLTKNCLRREETFTKVYRTLQILQIIFNNCFKYWLFPTHKIICVGIATLGVYGAIRMTGPRAIQMGVAGLLDLLYLSYMFKRLGKYYEYSITLLNTWKGRSLWFRKFVTSCRYLSIEVGSCYFIKKTTVIAIWGVVIDLTISILVA